jgi:hypothetical protein
MSLGWFRRGLDIVSIFNCYYLSFFLVNSMMSSIEASQHWFILLCPLPSVLMIFVVMPVVMKNYILLSACTAFNSKSETFKEVLTLMVTERNLVMEVQGKLKAKDEKHNGEGRLQV